ncbi:MAG: Hsp20/alpha crystallin family protein [Candidatus Hermodarchaeota archaeon]
MEENSEFEDEKQELEEEKIEINREKEKQIQEINLKRKQSFYLNQSKDISIDISAWGSFKTRSAESLEILEDESFYRTPITNIIETEGEFNLFVELPGLDKKHVNITLHEGILEILGDKSLKYKENKDEKKEKEEKKEKKEKEEKKDKHKEKKDKEKEKYKEIKGNFLRREFRSASFYRSFRLPEEISYEGIDASFKYGILRLKIPKKTTETDEKKVIEIK